MEGKKKLSQLLDIFDVFLLKEKPKGEQWHDSYKKDRKAFDILVKSDLKLEKLIYKVFKKYAQSVEHFFVYGSIGLSDEDLKTANRSIFDLAAPIWLEFKKDLFSVFEEIISGVLNMGGKATEKESGVYIGWTSKSRPAVDWIREHGAELVTNISEVTRDRLRSELAIGLGLGESQEELTARLTEVINDPFRASIIARTEVVKAYNQGKILAVEESGFDSVKTWRDGQEGACPVCSELDGVTVKLNEKFPHELDSPPAHPSCRCGMSIKPKTNT